MSEEDEDFELRGEEEDPPRELTREEEKSVRRFYHEVNLVFPQISYSDFRLLFLYPESSIVVSGEEGQNLYGERYPEVEISLCYHPRYLEEALEGKNFLNCCILSWGDEFRWFLAHKESMEVLDDLKTIIRDTPLFLNDFINAFLETYPSLCLEHITWVRDDPNRNLIIEGRISPKEPEAAVRKVIGISRVYKYISERRSYNTLVLFGSIFNPDG